MNSHKYSIFLGGPIQYAMAGKKFDSELQISIQSVYSILTTSGYNVLSAHQAENYGALTADFHPAEVTRRDMIWAQQCDIYICVLPMDHLGQPYRSDGTCIELGWVSALLKPIIVIWQPELEYSHLVTGLHKITSVDYLSIEDVLRRPQSLLSVMSSLLSQRINN